MNVLGKDPIWVGISWSDNKSSCRTVKICGGVKPRKGGASSASCNFTLCRPRTSAVRKSRRRDSMMDSQRLGSSGKSEKECHSATSTKSHSIPGAIGDVSTLETGTKTKTKRSKQTHFQHHQSHRTRFDLQTDQMMTNSLAGMQQKRKRVTQVHVSQDEHIWSGKHGGQHNGHLVACERSSTRRCRWPLC